MTDAIAMPHTAQHYLEESVRLLEQLRQKAPLVHSITNNVVINFTANVLLALGAAPAMTDIPGEAGPFAAIASGLLINLGTPTPVQLQAMREAALAANEAGTPWVLDPVAVGVLPVRTAMAAELLSMHPPVIRGNPSEILALAGSGQGGRGVDATNTVEQTENAAIALARKTGGVLAVSGPVDFMTDGRRHVRLANGTALLTRVTGGGCALGAVMAGFAALHADRLGTTVAAVLTYTVAAELAVEKTASPGSFAVAFVDALDAVQARDLRARARILV